MSEPIKRYKLSPELSDDDHWTVVDEPKYVIEAVQNWLNDGYWSVGEGFQVEIVEMTREAVDALRDI